jgi:polysaccharide export outer membrane protein
MKRILIGFVLCMFAAGALAQSKDTQSQQASKEKLGVGDTVRVTVFQQPDLTTDARVSERGTIAMPLIGETKVTGLTAAEAAAQIAAEYKKGKFLNSPQVSVALTTLRSRQVSVLGMVARPGRYPLEDATPRLSDVIAAAGGIATGGSETVTIMRKGKSERVDILTKNYEVQSGDTVYVERAPVFYIYGEVARAGAYPVAPNMTVMQAISIGGGITPRGSDRRLKMRTPTGDGKYIEKDVTLLDGVKPDDVIFVRESLF